MKFFRSIFILFIIFCLCQNMAYALSLEYKVDNKEIIKVDDFVDTQGHWAHDQILKWGEYDIVNGYNAHFMPDNNIIRGDLAIIIDRLVGLKSITYNYFTDLDSKDYYAESILKCFAEGYINGVGNKQVNPKGFATREEVAVIFCRVFCIDTLNNGRTNFKDDSNISSWARGSVYALNKLGYLNGTPDGYVNPRSNITRAELITLLDNFADTYIAKKGDTFSDTFIANFPKNVVLNKAVGFERSNIGRDVYLTRNISSINLSNTSIRGRLVCLDKATIELDETSINSIYLRAGKSTINGVTEDIGEVYICNFASETTLDSFPKKLTLEPGTRVNINGVMYENDSTRNKTYYSTDLKSDLAEEQGYVVGGPRISFSKAELSYDNELVITDVKVTEGENRIREIGIVWVDADEEDSVEDEDLKTPSYKYNDGKEKYYDTYKEPFNFEVGRISGLNVYRLYVRDNDGLYAYSKPFIVEEYDFDMRFDLSDEDYPEKIRVDVIIEGSNIPKISSFQLIYSENELYDTEKYSLSLSKKLLDEDSDKGYSSNNNYNNNYNYNYNSGSSGNIYIEETNEKRYVRFTGMIQPKTTKIDGEEVYQVPNVYGYVIRLSSGEEIKKFPAWKDVEIDGLDPIKELVSGDTVCTNKGLTIRNSKLRTAFTHVEEVGIAYRASSSDNITSPNEGATNWQRIVGGRDIGSQETYYFNTTISLRNGGGNIFYAPYIKTSNGYWYGKVEKIVNDWMGDYGAPSIIESNSVVIGNNVYIRVGLDSVADTNMILNLGNLGATPLYSISHSISGNYFCFELKDLQNGKYTIPLRIMTSDGSDGVLESNLSNISFEVGKQDIFEILKEEEKEGISIFRLASRNNGVKISSVTSATSSVDTYNYRDGRFRLFTKDINESMSINFTVSVKLLVSNGNYWDKEIDFTLPLYNSNN